ncbi:GUR-5 protein [Aphelenchoides avenae]|nr:GUR-5 protein [Aphelenchus avenae]
MSEVDECIYGNLRIWSPYDEEVYQVANVFVGQTRRPALGLSLWGFTVVSKSLMLKIGCAIITYLIVFVQLYPQGTPPTAANATLV